MTEEALVLTNALTGVVKMLKMLRIAFSCRLKLAAIDRKMQ